MSGKRATDEAVRRWALERARDDGLVYTADVAAQFKLSTLAAAKRLLFLRRRGYLVAAELESGRIGNELTEAGRVYVGEPGRRWDCIPLCQALGVGMRV